MRQTSIRFSRRHFEPMRERMSFIFSRIFGFLILSSIFSATTQARDLPNLPFNLCWQYSTNELSKFKIASDNSMVIVLPLLNGIVLSLNPENGEVLWKSELGGEIAAEIVVDESRIFAAAKTVPDAGANGTAFNYTISSLSLSTGVAQWQIRLPAEKDESAFLFALQGSIVLVTGSGKIHTFEKKEGRLLGSDDLKGEIASLPFYAGAKGIIFLSKGKIFRYDPDSRRAEFIAAVGEDQRLIHVHGDKMLLNDSLGSVSLYLAGGRSLWKTRAGAEIGNVVETAEGYMLSSNDNFVYFVSRDKGKRLWKTRLPQRTRGTLAGRDAGAFSAVGGRDTFFLESRKGRIINRISLAGDDFFINEPLALGNRLIVSTRNGVSAYGRSGCNAKGALD